MSNNDNNFWALIIVLCVFGWHPIGWVAGLLIVGGWFIGTSILAAIFVASASSADKPDKPDKPVKPVKEAKPFPLDKLLWYIIILALLLALRLCTDKAPTPVAAPAPVAAPVYVPPVEADGPGTPAFEEKYTDQSDSTRYNFGAFGHPPKD